MNFAWITNLFQRVLAGVARVAPMGSPNGPVLEANPGLDLWPLISDYSWLRSHAWLSAHPEAITSANVALLQTLRSLARHCELRRAYDDHIEVLTDCLQRPLVEVFEQLIQVRGPLKLAQGVLHGPSNEECLAFLVNFAKQPNGADVDLVDVLPEALSERFDQWLGDIIQGANERPEARALVELRSVLARRRLALAHAHAERLFDQRQWSAAFWAYRTGAQALYTLQSPKSGGPGQSTRAEHRDLLRKLHRARFERYELCRAMLQGSDALEPSDTASGTLSALEVAAGAHLLRALDAAVKAGGQHFANGDWESACQQYEIGLQAKERALHSPVCVSYREALRAMFPESGRNHAYALAHSGQPAECARVLELSHGTYVAELTGRLVL